MALKELRARTILMIVGTMAITGFFLKGVVLIWGGKLVAGMMFLGACVILSLLFKEKAAILYGSLIFLSVGFSLRAPFDRTGFSLVASILFWALTVYLLKRENKRRLSRLLFSTDAVRDSVTTDLGPKSR